MPSRGRSTFCSRSFCARSCRWPSSTWRRSSSPSSTRLAERDELDLEACGEFLVLFSALLELKARGLFPEEEAELAELGPEEAAEELARRLAEYRRAKEAAVWLAERLAERRATSGSARRRSRRRRRSRSSPRRSRSSSPQVLRAARGRAAGALDRAHGAPLPAGRAVPRALALAARAPLAARLRPGGGRASRASRSPSPSSPCSSCARRARSPSSQAAPFAPIRISRAASERSLSWTAHSA